MSILLLLSVWSFGQAISGDLVGAVKDSTGALVPNATVEATNIATGVKAVQHTNAQGEYHFVNLLPGHYSLAVTATGMKGGTSDVEVELNKVATANITTSVAGTSTTVEVSETAVTIDSTTPTISTTFTNKEISDSATTSTGSGVLNLSLLDAGVASSGGVGAGSGPSVGGQRPRNNNFTIEGVDNNSLSVTGPLVTIPNDAVDSFTVLQNQFSAEFGHSSGGQFNQTLKSGTNQFHGRAYEYFQNRNLNATDTQNAQAGTPFPRYDNNRFGGQVGGPIIKNKLFFFTNWEYNDVGLAPNASTGCGPTAAGYQMLAAAFPNNTNLAQWQKYVPAATQAPTVCGDANGNIQVTPGINSTAWNKNTNFLNIPVGDVGFSGGYYYNNLTTADSFDWVIGSNDSLRGRLVYSKYTGVDTAAQIPTFWVPLPVINWVVTLSEYHNFGTSVSNEFRAGFNRNSQVYNVGPQSWPGLQSFPNIQLYELNFTSVGPDGNAPQYGIQNTYQMVDNLSWVKGKHNFRFGGEYRWYIAPQTFTQRQRGDYEWNYMSDYLNDYSPNPNTDFAERSSGAYVYYGNKGAFYAYANDEWRISPTLTLNLGLRYEYTGEPLGVTKSQPLNAISNVPGLITFGVPTAQKTNFMPRLGIAWAPEPNTSVRFGFAMANDVIYDNLGLLSQPPQVQQTCDTQAPGQGGQSASCFWSYTNFIANGGLPNIPAAITDPATARQATSGYVPNQTLPYSETFTASVQHIFDKVYTLEVRWVGSRGLKLPVQTRLQRTTPVTINEYLPTYLSAPTQATLDSLPYTLAMLKAQGSLLPQWAAAGFNGNNVVAFEPYGGSKYNGLSVQLTRSFTNGLQFQAAYTWSHLLDNSTADVFSTVLTPRRPQNFQCFNCDWGTSALDRRQRLTLFAIYDLPFFKNSNWMMKNIVGNWQFTPVYTLQAPEYATCQSNVDANLNGDSAPDRCIYNPAGVAGTSSTVTALKNTQGATVAYLAKIPTAQYITAGQGAFPNDPRNSIATPWINNWDFSLLKRINITERQSIEFQFQATNIFNHAQYVPGYISDVGSIGYTGNQRNTLIPGQSNFEQWSQYFSNHPRNIVLALKYNF
jgi:Carboxypeptidase regulatory-like domain/TonB dependent receptor-like, beta-barrel